jgi:hypothetical protein
MEFLMNAIVGDKAFGSMKVINLKPVWIQKRK